MDREIRKSLPIFVSISKLHIRKFSHNRFLHSRLKSTETRNNPSIENLALTLLSISPFACPLPVEHLIQQVKKRIRRFLLKMPLSSPNYPALNVRPQLLSTTVLT